MSERPRPLRLEDLHAIGTPVPVFWSSLRLKTAERVEARGVVSYWPPAGAGPVYSLAGH